jgi:hypothetical protein
VRADTCAILGVKNRERPILGRAKKIEFTFWAFFEFWSDFN